MPVTTSKPNQHDALFAEIREALNAHQPQLEATLDKDCIRIKGTFVCFDGNYPFDQYQIEVVVPWLFPEKEPGVWETEERIPRTVDRHIYPSSGRCCLGLWEVWLVKNPTPTFARFLTTHMHSYFVGQTVFECTGEWVFGEESHSPEGIAESYFEAIDFPEESDRGHFFRLLTAPLLQQNPRCPCGSGERLSNCHKSYLRDLRRRIPAAVRKAMHKRLETKSLNKR